MILAFIGVKMLLADVVHIPIGVSLAVIAVVLAGSVIWSLRTAPPGENDEGAVPAMREPAASDSAQPVPAARPEAAAGTDARGGVGVGTGGDATRPPGPPTR